MLSGNRAERVGDQILKGIAELLASKVQDPRVKGVTLTGIDLSKDLRSARVYFSLIGEADDIKRAISGLDSAKGFIKRGVGKRVKLKYIPEIRFEHDPTLETGNRMEMLLRKIKSQDSEEF
jgi:ribosome-binding factor A